MNRVKKNITKILVATGFLGVASASSLAIVDSAIDPYLETAGSYELSVAEQVPEQGEQKVRFMKDKPEMVMEKWGGEIAMRVRYEAMAIKGRRPLLSNNVEWKQGNETVRGFQIDDENYEFEVELASKPIGNTFDFVIEGAKNLDFWYQPALTQEEIDEGAERPENVIGSYAVYHKTKANHRIGRTNYATGKAYHIYRPKAIDKNGAEEWAELSYLNGVLTVIVPQSFLDNAVYPVIVDPTFGYTTSGASFSNIEDSIGGSSFAPEGGGTGISMTIRVGGTGTVQTLKTKLYDNSNNALTNGETTEITVGGSGARWETMNFASAPALIDGTTYKLAGWSNADTNSKTMAYDAVTDAGFFDADTYGTWPDPLAPTTQSTKFSIYTTFACTSGTCTDIFSTVGADTWTAPEGVTSVDVECWGGGGGGHDDSNAGGGGGGGGGYASSTIAVTPATEYDIVIGAGGTENTKGASSTWEATVLIADGGYGATGLTGGLAGTANVGDGTSNGGAGGTGQDTGDTGGGGGGAGGTHGAGVTGSAGTSTVGGAGGAGDNGSGGGGGAGGDVTDGVDGTANVLGGGGGGGGDNAMGGGDGGSPGAGGGGGEICDDGTQCVGAGGQCVLTYTVAGGASSQVIQIRHH